jgi:hypothetical protein
VCPGSAGAASASSLQPSVPDAPAPYLTETGKLYFENLALKAIVESLIFMSANRDVIELALYRAQDTCKHLDIPFSVYSNLLNSILDNYKNTSSKNPFSKMLP